jgi:hypothetical protein
MNKAALVLLLLCVCAQGAVNWDKHLQFKLKKDQFYTMTVSEDMDEGTVSKDFAMKWTLFVNKGLVVTLRYDGFNHHMVLYKRYGQDTFKLDLLPHKDGETVGTYMNIVFSEFDDAAREAYFDIYIKDNARAIIEEKE